MKGVDYAVEVIGAGIDDVNGLYFPTISLRNGLPIYTQSGIFKGDADDCVFIWRFGSRHWQISTLKTDGKIGKDEKHYYISYDNAESIAPPTCGWQKGSDDVGDPPTLSIVRYIRKESSICMKKLKQMLYSEKYSDVHFLCNDGVIVHGHKIVIATSSSYFEEIFDNGWDEFHPKGIWRTSCSSKVIKVMLLYLYTGIFDEKEIAKQPLTFMDLAHECELAIFISTVEEFMVNYITIKSVKDILICADMYDLSKLKEFCLDFINRNMAEILTDKKFMNLAEENEDLWNYVRSSLI